MKLNPAQAALRRPARRRCSAPELPGVGVEPTRPLGQSGLSRPRIPIPPPGRDAAIVSEPSGSRDREQGRLPWIGATSPPAPGSPGRTSVPFPLEASALTHAGVAGPHARSPLLRLQTRRAPDRARPARQPPRVRGAGRPLPGAAARVLPPHARPAARTPRTCCRRSSPPRSTRSSPTSAPINVRPWLYRIARNRSLNHLRKHAGDRRRLDGRAPLRARPDDRRQGPQARGVPAADGGRPGPAGDAAHGAAAARDRRALLRADRRGDGDHGPVGEVAARARPRVARRGRRGAPAHLRGGPRRARRGRRGAARARAPPVRRHLRTLRALPGLPQAAARRPTGRSPRSSRSGRCCCSRRRCSPTPARPPPAAGGGGRGAARRPRRGRAAGGARRGGVLQAGAGALASKAVAGPRGRGDRHRGRRRGQARQGARRAPGSTPRSSPPSRRPPAPAERGAGRAVASSAPAGVGSAPRPPVQAPSPPPPSPRDAEAASTSRAPAGPPAHARPPASPAPQGARRRRPACRPRPPSPVPTVTRRRRRRTPRSRRPAARAGSRAAPRRDSHGSPAGHDARRRRARRPPTGSAAAADARPRRRRRRRRRRPPRRRRARVDPAPRAARPRGPQQDHAPSASVAPRHSTSDMNGPIWRGGKLTTATTSRPSSSSRA